MEERSLKITGTDKTFFNKLTSKLTKLLIPTKVGINGILVTMKRNALIKSFGALQNVKDYNKSELEKKYDKCYEAYLETLDKYILDSIYKKVKNNSASDYEKEALTKYYTVTSLKEKNFIEYKNRKQKYLIELDYEGVKLTKKQDVLQKYNEMYIDKMEGIFKAILKNYSIKIADNNSTYQTSKEGIYNQIFDTVEDYIQNVLPVKIKIGLDENLKTVLNEYEKYEQLNIGKLDKKDIIEKNTVLLGISRQLFTHSLPLVVATQCYEKLLKDARTLVQDTKITTKREKAYALLLFLIEDYNAKLLSTKVYWDNLDERDEFKTFWNRYNDICKQKEIDYIEYMKQKEILFIKNDLKKIKKEKIDYSQIKKYYIRKLLDYRVIRKIKDKPVSNGKYVGNIKVNLKVERS